MLVNLATRPYRSALPQSGSSHTEVRPTCFDEYLHIGETTARECLQYFCEGVREIFRDRYLRKPTPEDCQALMDMHGSQHGFPGMLGSIYCMHWKNCPAAWKGVYTNGFKDKNPTIVLEAVADYWLWIWHAYFGVAGSNNDINVLQSLPIFNEQCMGVGPVVSFVANGNQHNMGNSDRIYPMWPVFVKTIRLATDRKKIYFASRQEAARKDVERAFGVLQARWAAESQVESAVRVLSHNPIGPGDSLDHRI